MQTTAAATPQKRSIQPHQMAALSDTEVVVGPGRYFLGDPCYAVPDNGDLRLWVPLLTDSNHFERPVGTITALGDTFQVLAFHTMHGDGEYRDQHDHPYGVDAGLIGLTPMYLAEASATHDAAWLAGTGRIVDFTEPVTCTINGGTLTFGPHTIDTDPTEDDDEECWRCGWTDCHGDCEDEDEDEQ